MQMAPRRQAGELVGTQEICRLGPCMKDPKESKVVRPEKMSLGPHWGCLGGWGGGAPQLESRPRACAAEGSSIYMSRGSGQHQHLPPPPWGSPPLWMWGEVGRGEPQQP